MKVADLFVELRVEDQGSEKKVKDLDQSLQGTNVSAIALGGIIADLSRRLVDLGLDAAKAAVSFAVDMVKGTAEAGDEIAKTSKQLGVASDELQRVRFAAQRSGASIESTSKAIRTLTVGLEDALSKGTGPVAEGLEALGLSASDLVGLGLEERLAVISTAMGDLADESQRSAITAKLFGTRAGTELKPLLDVGADGIRELGDEAERLGGVLGEDALADSEAFADTLLDLETRFQGLVRQLGARVIPIATEWLEKVGQWIEDNEELIEQGFETFLENVGDVAEETGPILIDLVEVVGDLTEFIAGGGGLTVAVVALGAAMGGLPGIVIAAGAALGSFLADVTADLTGLNAEIAEIRALERANEQLQETTETIEGGTKAIRQIIDGTEGLSDEQFEDLKQEARISAGLAARRGGPDTRELLESQIAAEQSARDARQSEATDLQSIQATNRFLAQQIRAQGGAARAKELSRRPAGGGRRQDRPEEITGIPELDSILREQDREGGIALAAGGGARPGVATTINRIDQSFNAPTTITVEIDGDDLPEGDLDAMGRQIGSAIAAEIREENRRAADHFRSVQRT